ncbi:MAG: hypothetical protein ACJ8AI_10115 [Rhodopila sp.]
MPIPVLDSEPIVFTLLAAQAAALRDRILAVTTVQTDLLWQAADTIARQASLVAELGGQDGGLPDDLASACTAAAKLGEALDDLAFMQAQRADLVRQMAEAIVRVLEHLGAHGPTMSPDQIAAFYVSQDQQEVHDLVIGGETRA